MKTPKTEKLKKYQYSLVKYCAKEHSKQRLGIAYCWKGFGISDVAWIVDAITGQKQKSIWNYWFCEYDTFSKMEIEF